MRLSPPRSTFATYFWKHSVMLLVLACAAPASRAGEQLTYLDLVKRVTDLESLAVLPAPGEKCQQWSSYDRASKYDEATGKYLRWDANDDGNGIIRREGEFQVFAEMEGPGVIWRIWSAAADKGHVKIYLDGAAEPVVDLPFHKYFDGTEPPFQGKALCHVLGRGWNCYVPIPFRKSCKIIAEKGWGAYYHFTYTTYPQGTELPTFQRSLSSAETAALAQANELANAPRRKRSPSAVARPRRCSIWPGRERSRPCGSSSICRPHPATSNRCASCA